MRRIHVGDLKLFPRTAAARLRSRAREVQPLYLLADSQPLFWRGDGGGFLETLRRRVGPGPARAAYLGASNGDEPAFYSIFTGAMEGLGIDDCRMIPADPSGEDVAFLESADLVLLAGGSVERGWRAFERSGLRERIERRRREGAVLVGVSAGAVQLGLFGWPAGSPSTPALFPTFGMAPFVVDAHDETRDWREVRAVVEGCGGSVAGVGIPTGGGMVLHPDGLVEAVRHPLYEFARRGPRVACTLVLPDGSVC